MVENIVIFDFDETIGSFIQIKVFWEAIKYLFEYTDNNTDILNNIIKLFPDCFRPKIFKILTYLVKLRENGKCKYIMIYSNNPNKIWIEQICTFINIKLKTKVFDKIICAFKSKGQIIDISRTSNEKNITDLLKHISLPLNTKCCFIDDQYYNLMYSDNVYYINIKPYIFSYKNTIIIDTFYNKYSNLINISYYKYKSNTLFFMDNYKFPIKDDDEHKIDIIISKKLYQHIKNYFTN